MISTQSTKLSPPFLCQNNGIRSRHRGVSLEGLGRGTIRPRPRSFQVVEAGLLDNLFGSNRDVTATEEASELIEELFSICPEKSVKAISTRNDRIEEIIEALKGLNKVRNPSRSPLLKEEWRLKYSSSRVARPDAENNIIIFGDDSFENTAEVRQFGIKTGSVIRYGRKIVNGSNTFESIIDTVVATDFFGKSRKMEVEMKRNCDVYYLDERILLMEFVAPDKTAVRCFFARVNSPPLPTKEVESGISVGGIPGVGKKSGAATKTERSYKKKVESATDKAAEREAKQEEIRRQKEREAAEKEAALALKAEIKESVEAYSLRLKEAQANKKEAAAALKAFETENREALKEVVAFRREIEAIDSQIESLVKESQALGEQSKSSATEIKDCKQQLAKLERQLATF